MDGFTFITEMTRALAWPLVAAGAAMLARRPIGVLLEGLKLQRLKGAGWEFEFGELEAKVQQRVAVLAAPKSITPALSANILPPNVDPLAVIVSTWGEIERRVLDAGKKFAGLRTDVPFGKALTELMQAGVIRPATANGLRGLEALRNLAVHAPEDEALAGRVPHFKAMAEALLWNVDDDLAKHSIGKP